MDSTQLASPAWYRALSLAERLALRPEMGNGEEPIAFDAALAERRAQRWRSQAPFATGDFFAQRLAQYRLNEQEWLRLMGESAESLCERSPVAPAWLGTLASAYEEFNTSERFSAPTADDAQAEEMLEFLNIAQPLLAAARARVNSEAQQLSAACDFVPFDQDTIADVLAANLPWQLTQMLSRTMILELNVARMQGQLTGKTAQQRFDTFIDRLGQPAIALALLQEYPVLARQLATAVERWISCSIEFLRRLCADWRQLSATFNSGAEIGPLVHLHEAGDAHRGGRCVLIATFAHGLRVVYKPKSLAVDQHFQELLAWLNDCGFEPKFRTLKIIDRGAYGWVEFVEKRDCASKDGVRRFYERQGGQLALFYALQATDLHSENLVAAGEHATIVDLETLFHPHPPDVPSDRLGGLDGILDRSVLRTGLLPEREWAGDDSDGIDISGLGAAAQQQTPFGVPRWEATGTDEMRVVYKRVTIPGGPNRPTLSGEPVTVTDYADAVVAGFANVYRILMEHRQSLLAEGGPIARFAGDEVRVIVRPTTTYCVLMRESFHPDMLRDGLERDRLFDKLWVKVEELPCLARLIRAECEEMWQGDIPVFTTHPDSCDLHAGTGERVERFFEQSGMSLVRQRIEDLNEADLAQQLWIIRASLATLSPHISRAKEAVRQPIKVEHAVDRSQLLSAACEVGERLEALALRDGERISWLGLTAVDERRSSVELLGADLYDGLPGVAFFLAYLGAVTREVRWNRLARSALATLLADLDSDRTGINAIGAFNGWGGLIYTLTHLAALWDDRHLLAIAQRMVQRTANHIDADHHFDVVAGAAGCIGSVACLYGIVPSGESLAIAQRCGERLLAHATPAAVGIGWPAAVAASGPLTGFSHGNAGIAWALDELFAMTGDQRFADAARAAIDYERSVFDAQQENWPDLRAANEADDLPANGEQRNFVTAWCHGAPGIGLARLARLRRCTDPLAHGEVAAAVRATLRHGFGANHSLCHGDLGNLELLMLSAQQLGDATSQALVDRAAAQVLDDIRKRGWVCGVPQGIESPGLMTGLAGIGYGLLRLAEPSGTVSLLTLAPPLWRHGHA